MKKLLILLILCSCNVHKIDAVKVPASKIEPTSVVGISRVILTSQAISRLGIETITIIEKNGTAIIPASSLLYDNNGDLWIYVMIEHNTYVRHGVTLLNQENNKSLVKLKDKLQGDVVISGAAELYGAEAGVGK